MDSVREKCRKLMAQIMEVDPGVIHDGTNPENLEEWDSLSHVQLVLGLEKTFNIDITPEEGIENFENFKMIVDFLLKRTDTQGALQ